MTNQNTNRILKVIMMLAKIDKNITFHLSRHTFGTNLAVATSDQFLIKELMGHADIKTSMIYIHTSQEQIKNKLKNTDWG
jgi:site-specific recombinase XerD